MEILRFKSRYMDFGKSGVCQENPSKLCSESIKINPKSLRNRIVSIKIPQNFRLRRAKTVFVYILGNFKQF